MSKSPTGRTIDDRQPIKAALDQQAFLTPAQHSNAEAVRKLAQREVDFLAKERKAMEERLDREAAAKWLASFRTRR